MIYIVSYDSPNDRRRTRLAKLLEDYGVRVQYSVFEFDMPPRAFDRLRLEILNLIDLEEDNIRIYRICADCAQYIERHGVHGVFEGHDDSWFVL